MDNNVKSALSIPGLALVLLVVLLLPSLASAQDERPAVASSFDLDLVDRVAAVVGDSIILLTEVQEQIIRLEAGGVSIPPEGPEMDALRREILESLISQQLLLQAATRDTTIQVSEDRLDALVEDNIRERVRSFGSEAAMQRALSAQGQTMVSYRAGIEEELRRQLLLSQYFETQRRAARAPAVTEAEIRSFYEAQRARLEQRPATVGFRQVLIQPEPSDSSREVARAEAARILQLLQEGEDFESLARRFSQDPGSRQQGGDLGWFRRGVMVREFEDMAFRLSEGQVSGVVETSFGAHIIKLERSRGSERKAGHILIRAEVTDADVEVARQDAREVLERVRAGESMVALAREFGTGSAMAPDSLDIAIDQLEELPPGYAAALRGSEPGTVHGPIEFGSGTDVMIAVVRVREVREQGAFTFEDLRGQIEQRLREMKLEERIIQNLRSKAYIDIRI